MFTALFEDQLDHPRLSLRQQTKIPPTPHSKPSTSSSYPSTSSAFICALCRLFNVQSVHGIAGTSERPPFGSVNLSRFSRFKLSKVKASWQSGQCSKGGVKPKCWAAVEGSSTTSQPLFSWYPRAQVSKKLRDRGGILGSAILEILAKGGWD